MSQKSFKNDFRTHVSVSAKLIYNPVFVSLGVEGVGTNTDISDSDDNNNKNKIHFM